MPSLQDMRQKAKEAGLMKLDRLIATRQHIPANEFPVPLTELCERYEKLYTGCINDVMRELCLLNQNLPSEIMPLRDEMTVCGEAFTVKSAPNVMIEGEMTFHFTPNPDGTLSGDANGSPINFGFYPGDEFFKVDFPAGPGRWEVWAKVDAEGYIEGMISVGGNKGFPNLVYGRRIG